MHSRFVIRLAALLLFAVTNGGQVYAAMLADAAESGAWTRVDEILNTNVVVDESQADGTTALIWAAYHRNAELAGDLLRRGADANAVNAYGMTALSQAALVGDAATIGVLLEHGAEANAAAPEGDTPLMLASRSGNIVAVRQLLDAGAAVDARETWHGETALIWAAGENHADIVTLLIEHGAEVDAVTTELTWDLKQAGVASQRPRGGLTALMIAARENALESARVLLEHGADPNTLDPQGISTLRVAISNNNLDMGMLLLDQGADPNDGALVEVMKLRSFPVVRAAKDGVDATTTLDMTETLLAAGADVAFVPEHGMVRQLWTDGLNHPNEPALWLAALGADTEMMRVLGEHGADAATTESSQGSSVLMAAMGLTPHALGGGGLKPPLDVEIALAAGALAIELGARADTAKEHGETALHLAAQTGRDDLIPFLLEHGAPLDAKDVRNRMPIDAAEAKPGIPRVIGMTLAPIVHEAAAQVLRAAMVEAGIEEVPWVEPEESFEEYMKRIAPDESAEGESAEE